MSRFYQYLKKGLPKDEALRRAQVDMIRQPIQVDDTYFGLFKRSVKRDFSHPYYWAAFHLIGPWD
jgi:CHAT domain-containing protein